MITIVKFFCHCLTSLSFFLSLYLSHTQVVIFSICQSLSCWLFSTLSLSIPLSPVFLSLSHSLFVSQSLSSSLSLPPSPPVSFCPSVSSYLFLSHTLSPGRSINCINLSAKYFCSQFMLSRSRLNYTCRVVFPASL